MSVIVPITVLQAQRIPGRPGMEVDAVVSVYVPDAPAGTQRDDILSLHLLDRHSPLRVTIHHDDAEQDHTTPGWTRPGHSVACATHPHPHGSIHCAAECPTCLSASRAMARAIQEDAMPTEDTITPDPADAPTPAPKPMTIHHRASATFTTTTLYEVALNLAAFQLTVPGDAKLDVVTSQREKTTRVSASWNEQVTP